MKEGRSNRYMMWEYPRFSFGLIINRLRNKTFKAMKYFGYFFLFPILVVTILLATISTVAAMAPPVVNLIAPEDGATCVATSDITFSWNEVASADEYDWVLSATADFSSPITTEGLTTTTITYTGPALDYDTPYFWHVTAYREGGVIGTSTIGTFTTVAVEGADVNLFAPEDEATCVATTDVTFSWSEVASADEYDWVLSATADFSSPIATEGLTTTTITYTGPALDYDTPYFWQVTAYRKGCVIGTSTIGTFTTVAAESADVNLVTPEDGATCVATYDVAFSWSEVASADEYDWVLSATADLSSPTTVMERLWTTTTAYTGPALDYDTPYYWQVTAYRKGCVIGTSTVGTFTTVAAPIIESVDPSQGRRGSVIELNIFGVNFEEGSSIFITEGVEVLEASFIDSKHLVATVRITEDAPLGPQPVIVRGPGPTLDGRVAEVPARAAILDGGFTVITPPGPLPISVPIAGGVATALAGTLATHKVMKSRRRQKWQKEAEENPQEVCEPGTKCCQKIENECELAQCQIESLRLTAYNAVSGKLSEEKKVHGKIVDGLNMVIAASRRGEEPEELKKQIIPLAQALLQSIMDWLYKKRNPQNVSITGHLEGCKVTYKFKLKECKETHTWGEAKEEWEVTIKEERDESLSVLQRLEPSRGISEQLTVELTLELMQFIQKI